MAGSACPLLPFMAGSACPLLPLHGWLCCPFMAGFACPLLPSWLALPAPCCPSWLALPAPCCPFMAGFACPLLPLHGWLCLPCPCGWLCLPLAAPFISAPACPLLPLGWICACYGVRRWGDGWAGGGARRRNILIWMDLHMPIMDGMSATKKIRLDTASWRRPPIIVGLTAAFTSTEARLCTDVGMDCAQKPLQKQALNNARHASDTFGVRASRRLPALKAWVVSCYFSKDGPTQSSLQSKQKGTTADPSGKLNIAARLANMEESVENPTVEIARPSSDPVPQAALIKVTRNEEHLKQAPATNGGAPRARTPADRSQVVESNPPALTPTEARPQESVPAFDAKAAVLATYEASCERYEDGTLCNVPSNENRAPFRLLIPTACNPPMPTQRVLGHMASSMQFESHVLDGVSLAREMLKTTPYSCVMSLDPLNDREGTFMQMLANKRHSIKMPMAYLEAPTVPPANTQTNLLTGKRILYAEDNTVSQKILKKMLESVGAICVIVDDGWKAVNTMRQTSSNGEKFDCILMDCNMPVMDGWTATQRIRELENDEGLKLHKFRKHIPIIAFTANSQKGDRLKCLKFGMDDYLTKPVKTALHLQLLVKWCCHTNAVGKLKLDVDGNPTEKSKPIIIQDYLEQVIKNAQQEPDVTRPAQQEQPQELQELAEPMASVMSLCATWKPCLDITSAITDFFGSWSVFTEVFQIFCIDAVVYLDSINLAIQDHDAKKLASASHALRGASGALVTESQTHCRLLEETAHAINRAGSWKPTAEQEETIKLSAASLAQNIQMLIALGEEIKAHGDKLNFDDTMNMYDTCAEYTQALTSFCLSTVENITLMFTQAQSKDTPAILRTAKQVENAANGLTLKDIANAANAVHEAFSGGDLAVAKLTALCTEVVLVAKIILAMVPCPHEEKMATEDKDFTFPSTLADGQRDAFSTDQVATGFEAPQTPAAISMPQIQTAVTHAAQPPAFWEPRTSPEEAGNDTPERSKQQVGQSDHRPNQVPQGKARDSMIAPRQQQQQPQQIKAPRQGQAPQQIAQPPALMQHLHAPPQGCAAVTPNVRTREENTISGDASPGWRALLAPGRPLSLEEDEEMNLDIGQTVLQISQMLLQPLYEAIMQGSLPLVCGRAGLLWTLVSFLEASQAAYAERQQPPPETSPGPTPVSLSMVGTYAMELSRLEAKGGHFGEGSAVQMEKFTKLVDQISEVAIQLQVQQQERHRAKQVQCFKVRARWAHPCWLAKQVQCFKVRARWGHPCRLAGTVGDLLDLESVKENCHVEQFFSHACWKPLAACQGGVPRDDAPARPSQRGHHHHHHLRFGDDPGTARATPALSLHFPSSATCCCCCAAPQLGHSDMAWPQAFWSTRSDMAASRGLSLG
ncbi:hypothetical protein CYMTET_17990 [Cymbomonas tetramitiformis]|uniref:Uncharacterized protein n=1 Tax=Cymbomonas tetramitiformis TaxID=36881 RepID=A0AAE0G921_9CHLO|nr:hypothetical protein CYMTET_17990 [Cymbomonas tetramitiformis]